MPKAKNENVRRDVWTGSKSGDLLPEPVRAELQASIKWALLREQNAAATIEMLVGRISSETELVTKARSYASALKHHVARAKSMLPPDSDRANEVSTQNVLSETVILSLSSKKATDLLVRFLLQHAETVSDAVMFAAERLNSKVMHRLWRRADRARAKLVEWLEKHESLQHRPHAETSDNGDAMIIEAPNTSYQDAAPSPGEKREPENPDPHRIHYHPPQIVIWM